MISPKGADLSITIKGRFNISVILNHLFSSDMNFVDTSPIHKDTDKSRYIGIVHQLRRLMIEPAAEFRSMAPPMLTALTTPEVRRLPKSCASSEVTRA